MNLIIKAIVAFTLIFVLAGPASAMISKESCLKIFGAAGSNSNIRVRFSGNTLRVSGFVESQHEVQAVTRAAQASGAENVIVRVRGQN